MLLRVDLPDPGYPDGFPRDGGQHQSLSQVVAPFILQEFYFFGGHGPSDHQLL